VLALTDLTVNRAREPIGIAADRLAFGWKLVSTEPDTLQTRYRIVAHVDGNVVWDSGIVDSDRSVAVAWGGAALAARGRVQWSVQVWDNHDRVAQAASTFEIGLSDPADWRASFIEPAEEQDPLQRHPAALFRREFDAPRKVTRARLYATAHGIYEARINGALVTDALFMPGFTVYDRRLQYQTFDVTSLLREGSNCIGVIVTDGWYRGSHGSHQKTNSFGTQLGFLAQLEFVFDDGSIEIVTTDPDWRSGSGSIRLCDLHLGARIDAALEPAGWDQIGFDAASWRPVRVVAHDLGRLVAQEGPLSRVIEEIPGIALLKTPSGATVVDFGQNIAGHVRFSIYGERGAEIQMLPFEVLDHTGNPCFGTTVLPDEYGGRKYNLQKHRWTFRLSGNGLDRFEVRHTYAGFRYVLVEGWPGPLHPADVIACVAHSDMAQTGSFECSDARVNRLQENIAWSLRGNFVEIPTDCPNREKAGWTGDMYNFIATATLNRDVSGITRRWMKDVVADQDKRGEGRVTCVSPNTRTYREGVAERDGCAGWADAIAKVPWSLYQAYGDPGILAESYPAILAFIDFCESRARQVGRATYFVPKRLLNPWHWARHRHLITAGVQYGDWFRPGENLLLRYLLNQIFPPALEVNAIYARTLEMGAEIAAVLGKIDEAQRLRKRHAEVVEAFRAEFLRRGGRLTLDEQQAYVLALAFDLLPEAARQGAANRLAELIAANGYRLKTGFVSTPHLLPQLTRFGQHALAGKLLLQEERPSWLYEVKRGATTVWESWDGIAEDGRVIPASQNHFSLGAAGEWLFTDLGGIQAVEAGYRRLRIAPRPIDGLTSCACSLETPYGLVKVRWQVEGRAFALEVGIPPNTRAEIFLPNGERRDVGSGPRRFTAPLA